MSETMLIPKADLQAACNAIREKDGSTELILSGQLADKIRALPSGGGGGGDLDGLIDGSLTSVKSNASAVRDYAFNYASNLSSAELPNATSIGTMSFFNCMALTSLTAPTLQSIGNNAFQDTGLTSIDCRHVTSVGNWAFRQTALMAIELPLLNTLKEGIFWRCEQLTSIACPNVTTAHEQAGRTPDDDALRGAFNGCKALTDVSLPKLQNLTGRMFKDCSALQHLDFPALISLTWEWALGSTQRPIFEGANALTALILRAPDVCKFATPNLLDGSTFAAGTGYIYVPSALVDQYKSAPNWSTYANQIRAIEDYPEICGPTG